MEVDCKELKTYIKDQLDSLKSNLPTRIASVLEMLINSNLKDKDKIDIFNLCVILLISADQDPADVIANLLVPLSTEGSYQLDDHTISKAASFIRDYLKKEYLLYILDNKLNKSF